MFTPVNKPEPQAVSKAPRMLEGGILPRHPREVATNHRQQNQRYRQAGLQAQLSAEKNHAAPATPPCAKVLHISLFFDGTNNNEPADKLGNPISTTNIARLFHASVGPGNGLSDAQAAEVGFYRYYMAGVGTVFEEIGEYEPSNPGLKYATGGEDRINWALTRLIEALQWELTQAYLPIDTAQSLIKSMAANSLLANVSLGQLSNGQSKRAAALQPYLQTLQSQIAARPKPELLGLQLYVYGFSRGAAEARTFANWLAELTRQEDGSYRFAGIELSIEFLGLFDTVASVGVVDLAPFADGHMGWANNTQRLPDDELFLKRCVHLVSAHEQRGCFPLDSIRRKARPDDSTCPSTYRAGTQEFIYPGVHSDLGGGYPVGDQGKAMAGGGHLLSQVALHHMYNAAYQAGAPLQVPELALNQQQANDWPWLKMDAVTAQEFTISDTLVTRFNAWVDQLSSGPLEEVMIKELCLITGWRIERFANGSQAQQPYFNRSQNRDMTTEEVKAFKLLHKYQLAEDAAIRSGKEIPTLSASQQQERDEAQAVRNKYEARTGGNPTTPLNTRKTFDPPLENRQLAKAAADFRHDYIPEWSLQIDDGFSSGTLLNVLLGGLIYMTNDVDEAKEYATLCEGGQKAHKHLFTVSGLPANAEATQLIALFDEQVHDSRAWFMNAELNSREIWSDYFRYRGIYFDDESNRPLSLLVAGTQVIGVGIALASIGLTVKRKDPRFLLGLILPSLGTPVMQGKVGTPQISAFDPLTGLALPMLEVAEQLRSFSSDTGAAKQLAAALPVAVPLTAATATTPTLQTILKAHQQKEAEDKAQKQTGQSTTTTEATADKTGWLAQAESLLGTIGNPA